jgi:hypothetical protein
VSATLALARALAEGADLDLTMRATTVLAALGLVVNAVEAISIRQELGRFFDWQTARLDHPWLRRAPRLARVADLLGGGPILLGAIILQALLGLTVALSAGAPRPIAAWGVFALQILLRLRMMQGFDGADRMHTVIWGAVAVYAGVSSPAARIYAVGFIALQSCLAYWTSGVAKLASPVWRSGQALPLIFRTIAFGSPLARLAVSRASLALVLCWAVMLLEVLGPFAVLLGPRAAGAFALSMLAFHASTALVMGFNSFLFSFAAALPCVQFIGALLRRSL